MRRITSDTLAINLIVNNYFSNTTEDPLTTWGLYVAQHRGACHILAAMTMILELGFPLALVSRTVRRIAVPGAIAMLLGFRLLLGPASSCWRCVMSSGVHGTTRRRGMGHRHNGVRPRGVLSPVGRPKSASTSARARS